LAPTKLPMDCSYYFS